MLSKKFTDAVEFARSAHGEQTRKGTEVTYLSHLLAVAAATLEAGGDEELAIAAVLHDVVEDTEVTVAELVEHFGERVARIVEACSDYTGDDPSAKPPWIERKQGAIDHIATADDDVLIVALADKTHNAMAIADGSELAGQEYWDRFTASGPETLWYYRSLLEVFDRRVSGERTARLAEAVARIDQVLAQQMAVPSS